jgi:hypothetical protein
MDKNKILIVSSIMGGIAERIANLKSINKTLEMQGTSIVLIMENQCTRNNSMRILDGAERWKEFGLSQEGIKAKLIEINNEKIEKMLAELETYKLELLNND